MDDGSHQGKSPGWDAQEIRLFPSFIPLISISTNIEYPVAMLYYSGQNPLSAPQNLEARKCTLGKDLRPSSRMSGGVLIDLRYSWSSAREKNTIHEDESQTYKDLYCRETVCKCGESERVLLASASWSRWYCLAPVLTSLQSSVYIFRFQGALAYTLNIFCSLMSISVPISQLHIGHDAFTCSIISKTHEDDCDNQFPVTTSRVNAVR